MAESRIDELRRRLERDPESRLFAQLAEELRKDGDLEEAIRVARAGLAKHPNYPSARLTLGRALLDSGDHVAARAELEAAVQGAPDNILASRLLGEALETMGDLGSALDQYSRTLMMAPGDSHIETRIRSIQQRLGAPGGASGTASEDAEGAEGVQPGVIVGQEEEEEEGDLPPTIRIRMPGDPPRPGRAPLPPVPRASRAEVTQPPPSMDVEAVVEDGSPGPTGAESGVSATPGSPATPAAAPTAEPPAPGANAEPDPMAGTEADSGVTAPMVASIVSEPSSPTPPVEAGPAAGEGEMPAAGWQEPSLEEGRSEPTAGARVAEGRGRAAARVPGPTEAVPPSPGPLVQATGAAGPPPAEVGRDAEVAAPVAGEPAASAEASASGLGRREGGVVASEPSGAETTEPPYHRDQQGLSSATLAELYLEQGLLERAIEVYRQVLEEDPGNDTARTRLKEIETRAAANMTRVGAAGTGQEPDTEDRRRAIEHTIERLEALLAVVRRG